MIKIQFHGIDVVGTIKIQRVATLPVWTLSDIGRVLYTIDTDKYWAGGAKEWESLLGADPVATLPAWTTDDRGHIVYDESTGKYYGGGLTAWRSLSDVDVLSTKPVWAASDEGRIIYTTDDNKFYGGNDSVWKPLGGADFVATKPVWAATDEGRIIYVNDENKYYGGNDLMWKPLGGADILSTKPAWSATDEGRIIYADDENKYYGGNNEKWAPLGGADQQATLPTWDISYIGAIIYAVDVDRYYFGGSAGWIELGESINVEISSDTNAVKNTRYLCDTLTLSAGFSITLPVSPSAGDFIEVVDATSSFETYSVTVSSGVDNINNTADNLVLDIDDVTVTFIYSGDVNVGWFIDVGGNVSYSSGVTLGANTFTGTQSMPYLKLTNSPVDNGIVVSTDDEGTCELTGISEEQIVSRISGGDVTGIDVAEQKIIGRITGGSIDDLTPVQTVGIIKDASPVQGTVRQTVSSAFVDSYGRNDALYNGQVDFAQLRDTADAISGGYYSTYYPYNAFDGSDSTLWESSQTTPNVNGNAYIGMKNLKHNVKAVKFLTYAATVNSVTSVKFQYSTDGGKTWTDIQTSTVTSSAISHWEEISIAEYESDDAGLHSFRMLANSEPGAWWIIYTMVLLYGNNLDVCTTGNAYAYDETAGYEATKAFDNIWGATRYNSVSAMSTGNVALGQSGLTSAVKAVRYQTYSDASHNPKEVRLSWKQNVGDSWIDLATIAVPTTASSLIAIPVPTYSPSGSHYFAVRPTTNCAGYAWSTWQMEFYTSIDDDLSLSASSTDPLITSFASGTVDYNSSVETPDTTLLGASLEAGRTHFIYQDRDITTGAITYGKTPVVPQYGQAFNPQEHSLLHFEGADGSTQIIDEFGHNWVVNGNAQISTTDPKFGTGKLLLDGTGDSIKNTTKYWFDGRPFTIEGWWYTANNTANQSIVGTPNVYSYPMSFQYIGSSNVYQLLLSSNGSSWDIANAISSNVTASNDVKYKWIIEWDGYYYRVWLGTTTSDMKLIFNIKSSTVLYTGNAGLEFGAYNSGASNSTNGGMDEIRITLGSNRYGWSPVVETAAFPKYDSDLHWFDLTKFKMFRGNNDSTWAECQRVFLGEAYMDAHGVTDLRNYALNGRYNSGQFSVAAATAYIKQHNIGCVQLDFEVLSAFTLAREEYKQCDYFEAWNGSANQWYGWKSGQVERNKFTFATAAHSPIYVYNSEAATGYYRMLISRGW